MNKTYWRCHVCNDIHWGRKPPGTCPTCGVVGAFVEIAACEARAILEGAGPDPGTPFPPGEFRRAIEAFTSGREFQVNPDAARVDTLVEGIYENERNHGLKYCPCRLMAKDFVEDCGLVCPCNFPSHETYRGRTDGECWCGLFVKR